SGVLPCLRTRSPIMAPPSMPGSGGALCLDGLLPPAVETLQQQARRAYEAFTRLATIRPGISTCALHAPRVTDQGSSRPGSLLLSYGYYAVFVFIVLERLGIPLPGETTLIAAAIYAGSTGRLNIAVVFLVAAAAAILGDNAGYWIGRSGGQRLVGRYGRFVRL